jgi:hypothetical protein
MMSPLSSPMELKNQTFRTNYISAVGYLFRQDNIEAVYLGILQSLLVFI